MRIIFQELPVLGENSREIAKWSLAAQEQGKYFDFHRAIMDHRGRKDSQALETLAGLVGLDVAQLKKDMASEKIQELLDRNHGISRSLGINGTPGFIIGNEIFRGYLGEGGLEREIQKQLDAQAKG